MTQRQNGRRETQPVLIIEDSADDFEAATRAFARVNLTNPIKRAETGEEALAYLRSASEPTPGLILLDLNLPGLDGRKTLDIIKQNEILKSIPVVVLTTSDDERDIDACYALGANTFIQKPVDFDRFMMAIGKLKEYWFEIAILPNKDAANG